MIGIDRYNEEHESSVELKMSAAYENLPAECKHCSQLSMFNSCKLHKYAVDENSCPLETIFCTECQYCCTILNQENEELDYPFCSLQEVALEPDNMACHDFVRYEKEGGSK